MGLRQQAWARRARHRLLEKLGGKCAVCGTTEQLEFDCIVPQGDEHHRRDNSWRMSFYHAQESVGNLQILCSRHNNLKSATDRVALNNNTIPLSREAEPF